MHVQKVEIAAAILFDWRPRCEILKDYALTQPTTHRHTAPTHPPTHRPLTPTPTS